MRTLFTIAVLAAAGVANYEHSMAPPAPPTYDRTPWFPRHYTPHRPTPQRPPPPPVEKNPHYVIDEKPWEQCQEDIAETSKELEKISCKCKDGFPGNTGLMVSYMQLMTLVEDTTTLADQNTASITDNGT